MIERIPSSPPFIASLPWSEKRPIVSVMIPVYNCSKFLSEALSSVLAQDLGEDKMQIEVVDDASSDANVEEIVKNLGKGRVEFFKQSQNVGSVRNFETCINRSRGEIIHLLHGDDRVKLGFYKKMISLFEHFPDAGAAYCNYGFIDKNGVELNICKIEQMSDGILEDWLPRIASWQKIQYVSIMVKRSVYEQLGGFYGMKYAEDWEMWVRIARHFPVAYTPETLAEYRKHFGTISMPIIEDGQNAEDLVKAIHLIEHHLPNGDKIVLYPAKKDCALFCISRANIFLDKNRDLQMAIRQIKLALSLSKDKIVYYHTLKFYLKVALFPIVSLIKTKLNYA